jgi:hypothetical protein
MQREAVLYALTDNSPIHPLYEYHRLTDIVAPKKLRETQSYTIII